jgi:hypothetical protein
MIDKNKKHLALDKSSVKSKCVCLPVLYSFRLCSIQKYMNLSIVFLNL